MPRYIRYLENDEWKYASVKTVGDLSLLKTSKKGDVVEAINSLIDGGVLELVQGEIDQVQTNLDNVSSTVGEQSSLITNQQELIDELNKAQQELLAKEAELREKQAQVASDLENAKTELLNKADVEYVDNQLVKKVDASVYKEKYEAIENELLDKVNLADYQEEYDVIVDELGEKVNSIDYQSTIDKVKQDVANQSTEIEGAKTDISSLDTKVDNVKTDLVGTINTVQSDVDTLEETIAGQKTDLESTKADLAQTKTDLQGKINTANQNITNLTTSVDSKIDTVNDSIDSLKTRTTGLEGSVTTISQDVDETKGQLSTTITNLENVDGRLSSAETKVSQNTQGLTTKVSQASYDANKKATDERLSTAETTIEQHSESISLKAEKSDVYNKSETDTKLGTKVSTQTFNNKVAEIDITTDGIKQNVSDLQSTTTDQGTRLSSAETTIDQNSKQIALKASQTEVDTMNNTMGDIQSELSIQAGKIESKVEQDDYDTLEGKVTSQGTTITQLKDSITTKVEKDDYDALANTVSSQGTMISQNASGVEILTSKSEDIDGRLGTAESTIETQAGQIALKAEASNVYTKTDVNNKLSGKVDNTTYNNKMAELKVTTDGIKSTVSDVQEEVGNITVGGRNLLVDKTITKDAYIDDAGKVVNNGSSFYSDFIAVKAGDEYTFSSNGKSAVKRIAQYDSSKAFKSRYLQTSGNTYTYKIPTGVSYIRFSSDSYEKGYFQIEHGNKATDWTPSVEDTDSQFTKVSQDISNVDQKADSITQDVKSLSSTVTDQGKKITSQGTNITQLNESIALKAEKSDVYTKNEADNKVSSAVSTAKSEIQVTTDGIKQSVSKVDSKIDNMTIGAENILRNTAIKKNSNYIGLSTGITRDTTFLNAGLNTFKYDVSGLTSDGWRSANPNTFEAKEGEVFSSSAEVYIPTEHGIDVGTPTLEMQFFKADGSRITAKATPTSKVDLSKLDQWQKVTTEDIVAPAGTVKANTRLWVQRNGKLWVSHYMMNRGTKVADWSPSYLDTDVEFEDVNKSISTVDQKSDEIKQSVVTLSTKVDGQGTRISNAETTISQHTTSINLKANASDVYTKSQVDTNLGKKVDTTTYNNKMSSIDVDVSGIKQTASNQQTTINGIDGTVKSHTSQISTLDQRADGFDLKVKEVEGDIDGVEGRMSTAETQITANKNAIALKASSQSVSDLGNRVKDAEASIELNTEGIEQRVKQVDYDNAVGVNKWIASQYKHINLGSIWEIPYFDHIKGKDPDVIVDYDDSTEFQAFPNEDYYIAHYFTNVYLEEAKTITLSVYNDDGINIFMNGASIYSFESNGDPADVALSLRAGWNTIEFLHFNYTENGLVKLGIMISDQVDKMTSVIGVGNKDETRLKQAETAIIQNSEDIELRATKTDVSAIGNRVTNNESAIKIANDKISSKVEQTEFNNYSKKLTTAESDITQLKDEITSKVETTDFNLLNNTVKSQGTTISQLNESIALKVNSDVVDGLKDRVSSAESQITANKNAIALKASQSDLDKSNGRLSKAESSIELNTTAITQRVKQTDFDALSIGARQLLRNSGKFKDLSYWGLSKGSGVTGTVALVDDSIYGKVLKATYDGGTSWWVLQNSLYNYFPQKFTVGKDYTTTLMIKSTAQFSLTYMDGNGSNNVFDYSYIDSTEGEWKEVSLTKKAKITGNQPMFYLARGNTTGEIQIAWVKLEEGNKSTGWGLSPDEIKGDLTELGDRMHEAETSITQTASDITLKADKATTYTKTDVDSKIGEVNLKISNQATEIKQTNDAITLKANKTDVYTKTESSNLLANKTDKSDFNAVVTRVSNTEASLKVANDSIKTKVEQTTFDVLNDKVSLNTDSTNYNPNPSFEGKKSTGYSHATAFASTDSGVPTGAPKKYVGRQTGRDNYINDFFSVKAGDKFIVEGWIASTDSAQSFGLGLNTQDDDGNNTWLVSGHKSKGDGTWQYFKQTYTIPSGKNKARFFSQINATSSLGTWYFTDVRITKVIDQSQVDGLETKLSTMQTNIDQTSSAITLKANASDVYTKGQTDTKVNAKANQSDLNTTNSNVSGLTTRMTNAEASLKVQAGKIESKVEKQEFDKLSIGARNYFENGNFATGTTQGWSGFQNVSSVSVIDSTEYGKCLQVIADSGTTSRSPAVKNNEMIDVKAGEEWTVSFWAKRAEAGVISCLMKFRDSSNTESNPVSATSVNGEKDTWIYFSQTFVIPSGAVKMYATPRVSTSIASLKFFFANFKIEKGNRATDFSPNPKDVSDNMDSLDEHLSEAVTRITQTEKDVAIKANKTDVYTKTEANNNVSKAITDAKAEIKVTTDGISQNVSNLSTTVSGHTSTISSHTTSISQLNSSITSKAEKSSVYTKTEADGKISTAISSAKSEIKQTTDGITSTVSALDTKVGSISVGARNLLEGSGTDKYKKGIDDTMSGYNQYYAFDISHVDEKIEVGDTLTISFDVQMQTGSYLRIYDTNAYKGKRFGEKIYKNIGSKKIRLSWTFVVTNESKGSSTHGLYFYNSDNGDKFTIERIKIEKGNIPTDWTQAPEDVDQRMDDITIGARNLLLGTGNAKTATGTGGTNETTNVYDLINKDYSLIAGKQVTVSFDIVFSVDSGTAVLQYNNTPWGYLADRVNASKTKKHYSFTKNLPTDGLAKGIQLRLDNVTGTATVSNVKLEFGNKESAWSPAFEDIQVGGRNKILNSSFKNGTTNWSSFGSTVSVVDDSTSPTGKTVRIIGTASNGGIWYASSKLAPNGMEVGKEYTVSIIAKGSGKLELGIERLGSTLTVDLTSDYRKYTVTQLATSVQNVVFYLKDSADAYIHSIKLEEGNRATDWTPAPEDTNGEIDSLSTKISQTANEVSINVVKKSNVLASINASGEGIKIKGDKIDIAGAVTFSSLNSDMQSKVNAGTSAKTAFDNLSLGGTNLLPNSNRKTGWSNQGNMQDNYSDDNIDKQVGLKGIAFANGNTGELTFASDRFKISSNTQYTLSVWYYVGYNNVGIEFYVMEQTDAQALSGLQYQTYQRLYGDTAYSNGKWIRKEITFTTSSKDDTTHAYIRVDNNGTKSGTTYVYIAGLKIEKGNRATDWSPAPSDISNDIDSIQVGGANLLTGTNFDSASGFYKWGSGVFKNVTNDSFVGFNYLQMETKDDSGNNLTVSKGTAIGIQTNNHTFRVIKGRQYTVSMVVATSELDGVLDYLYLMHGNGSSSYNLPNVNTYDFPYVIDVSSGSPATRGYYRVSYTFTADVTDDKAYILVGGRTTRDLSADIGGYAWIRISQLQVEEGNKATSWSLSPMDVVNGVNGAISTASADATNKANKAKNDAISSTGSWISNYKVNTATILPLKDVNGNNLNDAYSYEVQARTTGTGTESTAIGYLLSKGDGAGWNLSIDYEMGSSSNHPKISINNGVPSISLYNHTTLYNVEVKLVAYRGRYLPSKKAQDDANGATSKANTAQSTANTAQSTANTATTKANTAQSTADSATTKANNAQNTANTANSTANYAKSTVDGGKSKWEGAYNLTQTWRKGNTTEIDGGNISTQSIQAKSMIMADFTNLCENPDFEYDTPNTTPMGFTGGSNYRVVDISAYTYGNGSNRALQVDASATASSSSYMSKLIPVSAGQQFYVGAEGRYYNGNGSGTGRIGFKTYDGKRTSDNHWYTAVQWSGTKNQTFDYKSGTFTVPAGVSYLQVWISFSANESTNNSFIIDNIRIHRMANAELIVDGVIEGRHIKADSISFDKAKGGTLKLGGAGNVNGILEVYSSDGELIANLDGDKGGFTSLYVADFESPTVVEYGSDNLSFYVSDRWLDYTGAVDPSDENSGNGWAQPLATIAEALRRIPKYFDGTATISLPYNGVFYENIDVMGFLGTGSIYINGGNGVRINGNIRAYKNLCSVYFKDFTVNGTSGSYANVQLAQNPYANMENVKIYGNNSQRCMDVRESGYAQLTNVEVYGSDYAICVRYGANCYMANCKGYGTQYGVQIYGGVLMGQGTCPAGGKGAIGTSRGSLVPKNYTTSDKKDLPYDRWVDIFTADSGSASPPPTPETTKTFSASSGNSWRDNYSGQWYNQGVVAQGYWGGYGVYRGLWFLGSSLSDTLKGKTIKSMRVYVKRTGSGGNSGAVTCYFRSHNYTSQPSGTPSLGSSYTTATFKWGEGKWINIPSSMWGDFTSGTAKGIGIYVNSKSQSYYARFGTSIQVEVTYK